MRSHKLIATIYGIQLMLALLVGSKVITFINNIKESLSIRELLYRYDYTILQDLITAHKADYNTISGTLFTVIVSYLLISIFIHAGLIKCAWDRDHSLKDFMSGGVKYYLRFLIVAFVFFVFAAIWTAIIWLPYITQLFVMIEHWVAEYMIIWLLMFLGVIYFLGLSFLFLWSVHTRLIIVANDQFKFGYLKQGLRKLTTQFRINYKIAFAYALILFGLYAINLIAELYIGISGPALVIIFLVFHQLIIWFKIGLRLSVYTSLRTLHD